MKTVTYQKIRIENFRSIRSLEIAMDGQNLRLTGQNGVGKTTVGDAASWVINGKFLSGKDVGSLCKPLDENNESDANTITAVSLWIEVDGAPVVLKKTLQEYWKRTTGKEQKELSTHTVIRYINGEEKTEAEYHAYLDMICPRGIWSLLMVPGLFLALKEDQQRKILLDISGEGSPEDVIALDRDLKPLLPLLTEKDPITGQTKDVATIKAAQTTTRNKAEKERDGIPAVINAHRSHIKDVPKGDHAGNVILRTKRLQELQTERAGAESAGTGALKLELGKLNLKLTEIETAYKSKGDPAREAALASQRDLSSKITTLELNIKNRESLILADESKVADYQKRIDRANADLDEIEARQEQIKAKPFAYNEYVGEGICSSCKQPLPPEMIEDDRAKFEIDKDTALKNFNIARARALEAEDRAFENTLAEGKKVKALLLALQGDGEISGTLGIARHELATAKAELAELKSSVIAIPEAKTADHTADADYIKLTAERAKVKKKIDDAEANAGTILTDLDAKIETAQGLLDEAKGFVEAIKGNDTTSATIAELETREVELTKQITEAEKLMFLCGKYIESWVSLMDERINAPFTACRWKLFEVLMNGSISSVCEALYRPTAAPPSTGQRLLMGIEIINVLQAHYGFTCPVWIDSHESLTSDVPMPSQTVSMYAVPGVEELNITLGSDAPVAAKPKELVPAGTTFTTTEPVDEFADDFNLAPSEAPAQRRRV